jgi:hypothetical protein
MDMEPIYRVAADLVRERQRLVEERNALVAERLSEARRALAMGSQLASAREEIRKTLAQARQGALTARLQRSALRATTRCPT